MNVWIIRTTTLMLGLWLTIPATARDLPDFTELVENNAAVVVNISTTRKSPKSAARSPGRQKEVPPEFQDFFRRFFENTPQQNNSRAMHSMGSGMIYSSDGYIVTNHHVVENSEDIIVRLSDRREFNAELIGSDSLSDLALLKIEAEDLPTAQFGDSYELKVGQWVLAIGSPFGFEHSATAGIISATGRSLPRENYVPFIQTDVAINRGNSGGPLFNLDGQVIGVNAQIYSNTGGFIGLSFAIPINMVSEVISQIKKDGHVARGWLGVYIQEITRDLAGSFGLDRPKGAIVSEITEDSPASNSDLQVGDIILKFKDQEVEDSSSLPPMVGRTAPGETVDIEVLRDGESHTIEVEIGELERDPDTEAGENPESEAPDKAEMLGMQLQALPEALKERLGLKDGGVVVQKVIGEPARSAGVQAGDVIQMFAGEKVESPEQIASLAEDLSSGQSYALLVQRKTGARFLALSIE